MPVKSIAALFVKEKRVCYIAPKLMFVSTLVWKKEEFFFAILFKQKFQRLKYKVMPSFFRRFCTWNRIISVRAVISNC